MKYETESELGVFLTWEAKPLTTMRNSGGESPETGNIWATWLKYHQDINRNALAEIKCDLTFLFSCYCCHCRICQYGINKAHLSTASITDNLPLFLHRACVSYEGVHPSMSENRHTIWLSWHLLLTEAIVSYLCENHHKFLIKNEFTLWTVTVKQVQDWFHDEKWNEGLRFTLISGSCMSCLHLCQSSIW